MLKSNRKSNLSAKAEVAAEEIYMDNASATPVQGVVLVEMENSFKNDFSNPSAIHDKGVEVKKKLEEKREDVAKILNAHKDEIIFTSGATEANNLAIVGAIKKFTELFLEMHTYSPAGELLCSARRPAQGISKNTQLIFLPHIITTNIEHPSVLEVCKYLEKTKQAEVTYVEVEENGIVDPKKIRKAIKSNTVLISIMYANNEIGTVQPILEIAKEIRHFNKNNNKKIYFHIDAAQAVNYLPINVEKLGIDLMSFNSGKIYGPKGIGALFVKRGTGISKIMQGGNQEFNLRPGTENLPLIVGFVEALKITEKIKEKEIKRLTGLRNYFVDKLLKFDEKITINGDIKNRLPNNINISIPKIPSDLLVIELSAKRIYVSEKSACKSGDKASSHVIRAIRIAKNPNFDKICKRESSIRFSLGRKTKKSDIDYTIKTFSKILQKLKKWY